MRTPPLLGYIIGLGILVLLAQCQKVQPQAPQAEGFDPSIPAQVSYLAGPITFDLRELEEKINRELDPVLVGKETKDGKTKGIISFRVKRLGPVHVEYADQQVKLSAPLQMWLTKPFSRDTTPPEKPFCALNVNFKSPIGVTPNWRLASHTSFTDYTWIVKPEVHLLGGGISLTKLVQHILDKHKTAIEMAIDSAVYKGLRLDDMVKPIWRDLQNPLLISKSYGLWLIPKPISVMAGPVTGNNRQITTHVRIALETQTELKPKAPEQAKTPLPVLQKREQVLETSDLHVLSYIPYADINRMLAITTNNKNKKLALGSLTINELSVYGGQQSLIVKANLSGLLDGTVYLRGRPEFDTLTNTLRVSQLDFDAETWKVLSRDSNTVWHKGLRKLLERLLTIPLGDDIAKLPASIDKAYEEGPGQTTDLGIRSFRFVPEKIAIRPDGIQALINVHSKVGVKINQL
ncbi:DUF4403 family protein [Spirosoma radiotolerans]|uniref:Uncharacterized protein n=1 Tax=Spirosoma radiotolerans TaxID=1379870 RepID=A0A0E3V6M2_9BACT|nr:DUF4403 family protein [Spirosoma radiotolerans]AKD54661.1 hypothetical protein SD10_06800 [Spirosoma radiotolerans]